MTYGVCVSHTVSTSVLLALVSAAALTGTAAAQEPLPPSSPAAVPLQFNVDGWADVRTGIRGRVTIKGTFNGTYDPASQTYVGGFALTPTRAKVTALGLLPVTAETDWSFTEPVTGTWRDGTLTMRAAARIHHPRLLAFGSVVVAGGAKCATREASVLNFSSRASEPVSSPEAGGTLTTEPHGFAISGLSGCGLLDGLLSAVAAGRGSQATMHLSPIE